MDATDENRIRSIARLLDTRYRIPVLGWSIGIDGLVGLIPGVGDVASLLLSGYLFAEAKRAGCKGRTFARMAANVAIDTVVGSIPLIGDLFDIWFKSNTRNAQLILDEAREPSQD